MEPDRLIVYHKLDAQHKVVCSLSQIIEEGIITANFLNPTAFESRDNAAAITKAFEVQPHWDVLHIGRKCADSKGNKRNPYPNFEFFK
jgi:hypothetical protein